MKDYFIESKKSKQEKLTTQILQDALEYNNIVILCIGPYKNELSPFLCFASKVGTILKMNNIPVYGDATNPILIDKKMVAPIAIEIDTTIPNAFVLVVMNSISDDAKILGNFYYENKPYQKDNLLIGNATLMLCGSFGKTEEEIKNNSLSEDKINELATEISLFLIDLVQKKQEETLTRKLKKEDETI